jgi:hypothetical protein
MFMNAEVNYSNDNRVRMPPAVFSLFESGRVKGRRCFCFLPHGSLASCLVSTEAQLEKIGIFNLFNRTNIRVIISILQVFEN